MITLLVIGLAATGWAGQAGAERPVPAADSLQTTAVAVANLWARGEADSVGLHLASPGVRIALPEGERGLLAHKPAVAVLESLFRGVRSVRVRVRRVDEVGGSPPQGFAELRWEYRAEGMPELTTRTVFLGFTLDQDHWRITEIRVFD